MIPTKLNRRTYFRVAALFALLFSIANVTIFSALYFLISNDLNDYIREHVDEVRGTLAAVGESGGQQALIKMVGRHADVAETMEDIYLLVDDQGNFLAGNIRQIPIFEGWKEIPWKDLPLVGPWQSPRTSTAVVGRWTDVKDGHLFVADGNGDVNQAQQILLDGLAWCVAMAVLSAVLGGLLLGYGAQRRVTAMEAALDDFALGNLNARIPRSISKDDLDHVASLINRSLERLQNLIGEVKVVTTDIAHDLKTPLSRMRQKLETVQSSTPDLSSYQKSVSEALSEIDDIVGSFEALLRIAEVEGGARRAQFTEVGLKGVLWSVSETLSPVAEDQGLKLQTDMECSSECLIRGDRQLLNQLFVNLIENSIRHCPRGSTIWVGLKIVGDHPVATITDNGPGIPEEERGRVFRRLYRLEKSRTTPGSGLGLSLVAAIADLHDAEIALHDNNPGLAVTLRFPSSGPS